MVQYIIIGFSLIMFVILIILTLIEFPNLNWVNSELKKPLKRFSKTKVIPDRNYELTLEIEKFYKYYEGQSLETLQNLDREIYMKRTKYVFYSQLTTYITSLLGTMGLIIAGFAMISNDTPVTDRLSILYMVLLFAIPLVILFFLDLTFKIWIVNPMDQHLTAIQKVIKEKESKVSIKRRPRFFK
ncbi:hypothetical protein [Enterobacter ludwigii]|uniref:hypothetical protein n=1 Tax=Enterobacter ludwigii TaxID=299767 RepID=UPI003F70332E